MYVKFNIMDGLYLLFINYFEVLNRCEILDIKVIM